MIRFGKTCIVHTFNFSTLVTCKIYLEYIDGCETFGNCRTTIPLTFLKVSNLYTIPCGFYGPPNEQNWMCELCMFSQIHKTLLVYMIQFTHKYLSHIISDYSQTILGMHCSCTRKQPATYLRCVEACRRTRE